MPEAAPGERGSDDAAKAVPDDGARAVPEAVADSAPTGPTTPPPPARRWIDQRINRRKLLTGVAGLVAVAAAAGVNEWVRRSNSHGPRIWHTTAASGRLELTTGRQPALYVSGFDGTVRALDPRTGEVRWSHTVSTPHDAEAQGGWPLAAGDGVVCVATDTHLRVLDAQSGEQRWEAAAPYWSEAAGKQRPAVGGGSVFAAHGSAVRCYELTTGDPRWTGPVLHAASLALDGDTVYAAGTSAGVVALDARTGGQLWERKVVANSPLTAHRGALLVTSESMGGTIVAALDGTTGDRLWESFQHGDPGRPAALGRTVYMGNGDRLYGLDTETGDWVWKANAFTGRAAEAPAVVATDGGVYAATAEGRLWAFDPSTGAMRWQDDSQRAGRVSLAAAGGTVYHSSPGGVVALGTQPAPPAA
ncbi:outer membrane protein assembly factor BamB family protein [Kitasatospora sp. NPDC002543]